MTADRLQALTDIVGPVSRETLDRLTTLEHELERWNSRINLVSPTTIKSAWSRHILDSAQVFALAPKPGIWVDIGSGGGFPGLVIAILLKGAGQGRIHLVESNRKKASFLQSMAGQLALPTTIHATRIETVDVGGVDYVSARALAGLDVLLSLSERWLAAGAVAYFHKGRDYRSEVEESLRGWRFDLIEHASAVEPDGMILEIARLQRRETSQSPKA